MSCDVMRCHVMLLDFCWQDNLRLLLVSAFKGLTWSDSNISLKCTSMACALVDKVMEPGCKRGEEGGGWKEGRRGRGRRGRR